MTIQTNGDDCRESGAGETSKQQFERWIRSKGLDLGNALLRVDNRYYKKSIQDRWEAWQASRAAIEIDLPVGGYYAGYECEHMMESRDVREAIQDAGLKLKGEL